jgi:hypothetical protein
MKIKSTSVADAARRLREALEDSKRVVSVDTETGEVFVMPAAPRRIKK